MSNTLSKVEPLVFIETDDGTPVSKPQLKRQITFLKGLCRPLSHDDNPPNQPMINDSGFMTDIAKVTFSLDSLTCGRDGICSECQLSREIEESYQSEKDKCTQQ